MSAFAGVFFRRTDEETGRDLTTELARVLSIQSAGQHTTAFSTKRAFFLKFDPGSFGTSAATELRPGQVAVMAGHPYVDGVVSTNRSDHLGELAKYADLADLNKLSNARGSYCMAFSSDSDRRLVLAADCLGIRPLYYWADSAKVIFANTLKTFEMFRGLQLGYCERGAIELAVFGYSLADRTQFANVKCLRGGEALTFTEDKVESTVYWQWKGPQSSQTMSPPDYETVFNAFTDAVRLRLAQDQRVMAFLTGGMDSRCIVAELGIAGAKINTSNFAPANSQDLLFGARLAKALATRHYEYPMPSASVASKIPLVLPKWIDATEADGVRATHPKLIWSGDGGSVGLGHVYLNDDMVSLAEGHTEDDALQLMLKHNFWQVPVRTLRAELAARIGDYPLRGLRQEFDRINCADPGRKLHILLMITDQHRHLFDHYERIFETGCELHLPFFDREFLASVIAQPARPFINHRFYNRWMKLFPRALNEIPWQAYPLHEPCPVPITDDLKYQWNPGDNKIEAAKSRQTICARTLDRLLRREYRNFPIDGLRLWQAWLMTTLRIRNYDYALTFADTACPAKSGHQARTKKRGHGRNVC